MVIIEREGERDETTGDHDCIKTKKIQQFEFWQTRFYFHKDMACQTMSHNIINRISTINKQTNLLTLAGTNYATMRLSERYFQI